MVGEEREWRAWEARRVHDRPDESPLDKADEGGGN